MRLARLEETPEYVAALRRAHERGERRRVPVVELFRGHKAALGVGFLSITGHNALNYSMAVFALSLMTSDAVGVDRGAALAAVTIGSVFGIAGTPVGGWAADRFGAGRVLAFGSGLGTVFAFPLFAALASGSAVLAGTALAFGYGVVIACTSGAQGAFLAGLFPARERYSGIALAREANGAVVAGFTPLAAAALMAAFGGATWPAAVFVALCCLASAVPVALWRRKAIA